MTIGARVTIAEIAATAFALCDLVHEVVGHGIAVLLVPGVHAISLSPVALQTTGGSRLAGDRFAAMAGLTAIPKLVENRVVVRARGAAAISFSAGWVGAGLVVAVVFTAVIGRGIAI